MVLVAFAAFEGRHADGIAADDTGPEQYEASTD
jgi:hypothetical protein